MRKPEPKEVKKFFGRMLAFTIITASIITVTVLLDQFGPPNRVYSDSQFNFGPFDPSERDSNVLIDQHSHTIYSDGLLTPKQNVLWHIAHGFNACILTDHHTIQGALEAKEYAEQNHAGEFIVIVGQEWNNDRIHMNFLGINTVIPAQYGAPSDEDIKNVIKKVHDQGGLVTVNHIPWSLREPWAANHPNQTELWNWGVDFIEIVNGAEYDEYSDDFINTTATNMSKITGTDMHSPKNVHCWTQLNVSSLTEANIMTELAAGNTAMIYNGSVSIDETGEGQGNPAYEILKLPMWFGDVFEDIYYGGIETIVIALLYLFGVFFTAEALRILKRKYWAFINARKASKSS
ncbi:MAG: PHP domain-containing protein [Candidatus Hodarchaeota archaeon]